MNSTSSVPGRVTWRRLAEELLAIGLFILLCATLTSARAAGGLTDAVRLIVVFHPGTPNAAQFAKSLANGEGTQPDYVYTRVVQGFSITLPSSAAQRFTAAMRNNPVVSYVEQDVDVQPQQLVTTATPWYWNLDRIDQRAGIDGYFSYMASGTGVRIYVVDSGVRASHSEFGGRVLPGYTAVADGQGTNDCFGHGTYVSSIAAGATMGVARNAWIVPARIFDCAGAGTGSGLIAALDWVAANAVKPAVVNMSLGSAASRTTDSAVASLGTMGVAVVTAAGNQASDACNYSPAREPSAMTVAATNYYPSTGTEIRAGYSNFGSCVDLFAPGSNVYGAGIGSDTAIVQDSGTSASAPLASGVAAQILEAAPTLTGAQVQATMIRRATTGLPTNAYRDSPLLVLYALNDDAPMVDQFRVSNLVATTKLSKNNWSVTVTPTLRDVYGKPVANTVVTGRFTSAAADSSCTTGSTGTCGISTTVANTFTSTTFSVTAVTGRSTYTPAMNYTSSVTATK